MAVDWNVLKTDYLIHGELTLTGLAKKYGVSYRAVVEVATRECWNEERELRGAQIQRKALALAEGDQVTKLAQFDAEMLRQAEQLRELIAVAMLNHRKPHELRQLQAASEGCLRMGHLCLGAATQNTQVVSPFDVDASRERLFNEMLAAQEEAPEDESSSRDESSLQ